jgi:hypothetical protein
MINSGNGMTAFIARSRNSKLFSSDDPVPHVSHNEREPFGSPFLFACAHRPTKFRNVGFLYACSMIRQSPGYLLLAKASKASLLRINSAESFGCAMCRFFSSAKRRVTVSREVPNHLGNLLVREG